MRQGAGRRYFIRTLTARFPAIARSIDITARNLLHAEMGYFADSTQQALERGEESVVRTHFSYAEELMQKAGPDLANAIQVSYLEFIQFDAEYPNNIRPRSFLPPLLRQSLAELEEHLRKINDSLRLKTTS
jgi:hypothetical protein